MRDPKWVSADTHGLRLDLGGPHGITPGFGLRHPKALLAKPTLNSSPRLGALSKGPSQPWEQLSESPRYETTSPILSPFYLTGSVFSTGLKSFIPISPISRRRSIWEDRNLPFSNRAQVCPKLDVDGAATAGKNQVVAHYEATQVNGCWACTLRTCTSGGTNRSSVLVFSISACELHIEQICFFFITRRRVPAYPHTLINAGPDSAAAHSLMAQFKPEKKPRVACRVDYPVRFRTDQ